MPQRFLRPGITTSDPWNACGYEAQSLYVRLLTVVDDYGRYDGRASIICGACFALRPDMTPNKVEKLISELVENDLVDLYTVDGKKCVQLEKWQERARGASKYPAPQGADDEEAAGGKIYFMQGEDSKRIKIGFTKWNVEQRLNKLQTGSPERLKVLFFFDGTLREERSIHRQFSSFNVGGEWFKGDQEILKFIENKSNLKQTAGSARTILPIPASLAPAIAIASSPKPSPYLNGEQSLMAPPSLVEVLDAWNKTAEKSGLPKCLLMSDKRRRHLTSRIRNEFFIKNWKAALVNISKSPFCLGVSERGWRASFDWFITPDAVAKVMEGKYDQATKRDSDVPQNGY